MIVCNRCHLSPVPSLRATSYGIYMCYVIFSFLALVPPIDCRSVIALALLFLILAVHMHYGMASVTEPMSAANRAIIKVCTAR